jgi:hypothetical protein
MKSLPLAAAALLFGTSALAFAPATEPAAAPPVAKDPFVVSAAETTAVAPILQTASADSSATVDTKAGDPDLDLAVDPDRADAGLTGVGGPEEPLDVQAPAAPAAAVNYPPCRPGPGDDRCIQLYEPGVREALANWTPRTGGPAGDASAMGGPYEPVDDAGAGIGMVGDGVVDPATGETPADEEVDAM